jgi:hypothetical protein
MIRQRIASEGSGTIQRFPRGYAACLPLVCILGLMSVPAPSAQATDDSVQRAVNKAHGFLKTEKRGKNTLGYVHFGADYHGHLYQKILPVFDGDGNRIAGHFKLVYRFKWEDDGVTDVAYLCDDSGDVYAVQTLYTNAIWSQPFLLANAAIQVLGNALIEANKDKMKPFELKLVQKLVDNADAKGLLELSIKFDQAFGNF